MTVTETSLYANLHVETAPVASTAVWTDHIAKVRDISVTRGGREPYINVDAVEAGSGTITLVGLTATILPGYWVRIRYSSTNIWTGFVQDISTDYTFIANQKYAITTLYVIDWVGWISQYAFSSYAQTTSWWQRPQAINAQIDSTGGSLPIIEHPSASPSTTYSFSEINSTTSVADVLNLLANSVPTGYWKSTTNAPTGSLAAGGMDSLIDFSAGTPATPTVDITDGSHTGTPTNLVYYNDVMIANRTSSVVNNAIINDSFVYNGENIQTSYSRSDATSIAKYGLRSATVETAIVTTPDVNLFPSPSFNNTDIAWSSTNWSVSVQKPSLDSTGAWAAKNGDYALRVYNTTGSGTFALLTDDQRIDVQTGVGITHYFVGYAAHSNSSSVRGRAFINWYLDDGSYLTSYSAYTTFTSTKTWYKLTVSASPPAGFQSARVGISVDRSTGAAFATGSKIWGDAYYFGTSNMSDWFDGSFNDSSSYVYDWMGTPDNSYSIRMANGLYTLAGDVLQANKNAIEYPESVRLNAQQNITQVLTLDTYKNAYIWYSGNRWNSTITGIGHNITINEDGTTRWMVDLITRPTQSIRPL